MAKLLITGASGYIGGKLAEYFIEKGWDVSLMVRREGSLPPQLQKACQVFKGDVTRPATLPPALRSADMLINAAGLLGNCGRPRQELFRVNVQGAVNLAKAAQAEGVRRVVHLSAAGITGPLGRQPADESYPPAPRTDYERSKWEGERRLLDMAYREGWNLMVVRPTFTYGPGDPHKLKLFRAVKSGLFAFIGNGLSTIHPVYIDDLMTGIELALKSDLRGIALIVGGERPVTKRELIWSIADALHCKRPNLKIPVFGGRTLACICTAAAKVLKFDPPLTHSKVLMLSRNWGYSIERARQMLGYQPRVSLQEGLRKTVNWYRERGWL